MNRSGHNGTQWTVRDVKFHNDIPCNKNLNNENNNNNNNGMNNSNNNLQQER